MAGTATYSLRLEGVRVEGAGRTVLGPLSFTVSTGETVVVAGKSGFGGTTLARVVAGTVHPDTGQVYVGGQDVTEVEPAQRHTVGYLPAGGGLLPHLDIESNIRYGLRLRGNSEERVSSVVGALDLKPSLGLRPHELSPGGRFRAAIARIAVRDSTPELWVVDATRGGHVPGLRDLLVRVPWPRPADPPGVLICADDSHASAVTGEADQLLVVQSGKASEPRTPAELRTDPPDLLTARLVLPAPLPVRTGNVVSEGIQSGSLLLPRPPRLDLGSGQVRVALPVRALSLSPENRSGGIRAWVVEVKPEGTRVRVIVEPERAPGERWPVEHHGSWPRSQRPLNLRVDPARLLVFDSETGKRIPRQRGES